MKKSKIFLGLTSLCLAVAAIAATKANSRAVAATSGYTQGASFCTDLVSRSCFTSVGGQCTGGAGDGHKALWKHQPAAACLTAVFKDN
jgi:hypothetical protein